MTNTTYQVPMNHPRKHPHWNEFLDLSNKWKELGFVGLLSMASSVQQDKSPESEEIGVYGYIHRTSQTVPYGHIFGIFKNDPTQDEDEAPVADIAMDVDPDSDFTDIHLLEYVEPDDNEEIKIRLHVVTEGSYIYFNKDIELLKLIKNKYCEVVSEISANKDMHYVDKEIMLMSSIFKFLKKVNKKGDADE